MRELFSDAISARIVDSKLAKKKNDDFRCKFYLSSSAAARKLKIATEKHAGGYSLTSSVQAACSASNFILEE